MDGPSDRCPNPLHPDHHLWRNGRRWWVAFTVVWNGWRQERVRRSLGTTDLGEARCRRDALLRDYGAQEDCQLSLRFTELGRSCRRREAAA